MLVIVCLQLYIKEEEKKIGVKYLSMTSVLNWTQSLHIYMHHHFLLPIKHLPHTHTYGRWILMTSLEEKKKWNCKILISSLFTSTTDITTTEVERDFKQTLKNVTTIQRKKLPFATYKPKNRWCWLYIIIVNITNLLIFFVSNHISKNLDVYRW